MTDTRSERDPKTIHPSNPNKTMMGATQKAWFKQQILDANQVYPVIIWVSTSPWIANSPGAGIDNWNGFRAERRELADFIKDNKIRGFHMIAGDVHMLAIDDGTNNNYATGGGPNFPIMQAAALSSSGTFLIAHTYSEGQYPGKGHFGLMTIEDKGFDCIDIRWSGRNTANEEIVSWERAVGDCSYLPLILNA
jgi:phosphodiesterase/alkaline phosphatase D-like protein